MLLRIKKKFCFEISKKKQKNKKIIMCNMLIINVAIDVLFFYFIINCKISYI